MREEIPALFGLTPSRFWQQGYVSQSNKIFLFVTLDKSGMPQAHRYIDRFLGRDRFEWKSQNQHTRTSKTGLTIRDHVGKDIPVYLFVRKGARIGPKAAPFIYCGELSFEDWEDDKPITVRWRLKSPLPDRVAELFGVA
jgi:hypothetical protein